MASGEHPARRGGWGQGGDLPGRTGWGALAGRGSGSEEVGGQPGVVEEASGNPRRRKRAKRVRRGWLLGADRSRWVGRGRVGRRWARRPGGSQEWPREGAVGGPGRRGDGEEALGSPRGGHCSPAGAGGGPLAAASLPGAPGAAAAACSQSCRPAFGAAEPGERAARPNPSCPHSPACPCGHGGVRAASARSDHGGARLRQGHRVVAHHQTLRAEAPLQRGSASRQHTSGHRWEPRLEGCCALSLRLGFEGGGPGAGGARPGSAGPGMRVQHLLPSVSGGELRDLPLLSH